MRGRLAGFNCPRLESIERLFTLAELLRQFRFGCSIEYATREVGERMGRKWCEKTTRRDLEFLVRLGLVTITPPCGELPARYRWTATVGLFDTSPDQLRRILPPRTNPASVAG